MSFHNTPDSVADINRRFGMALATGSVAAQIANLAHQIDRELPPGRERSLALTKLEEAMFWTEQSIKGDKGNGNT